jgi:hypothetical protein
LRKGGKREPVCEATNQNGVSVVHHPIAKFTPEWITSQWGFSPDYWVHFSELKPNGIRETKGAPRRFGLLDSRPAAKPVDDSTVAPLAASPTPSGPMAEPLSLLMMLRDITSKDADARVKEASAHAAASLQSSRESNDRSMSLMLEMFRMMRPAEQSPASIAQSVAAAVTPLAAELATFARSQAETNARLTALLEEEPEDEPDEPDDDEKIEKLVRRVEKDGAGAILSHFKGQSLATLLRALPKLQAKAPEALAFVSKMLGDMAKEGQPQPSTQAAPAPAARPAPAPHQGGHTNGHTARAARPHRAPPAPPPPPPAQAPLVPDGHEVRVE